MLAADRVDSTTGLQMAYLKQWAPRAHNDLELRVPELLPGRGTAVRGDAMELVDALPPVDLAYLDPPYNQHRYFTNYHIWETLVALGRAPSLRRRVQAHRQPRRRARRACSTASARCREALAGRASRERAPTSSSSRTTTSRGSPPTRSIDWLRDAGHEDVRMLAFDSKRYVGAQIGIYNPTGEKVGKVSHLRNIEYVFVAGSSDRVECAMAAAHATSPGERFARR